MGGKSSNVEMAHAIYHIDSNDGTRDHFQKYNLEHLAEEFATLEDLATEEKLTKRKRLFKIISIIKIFTATDTYPLDVMELIEWRRFVEH